MLRNNLYSLPEGYTYILGYENLYGVNKKGEIFSCHLGKEMCLNDKNKGYLSVVLCKDGKHKRLLVHRIVLQTFYKKSNMECNHIDGNKCNNDLKNLEYCTRKQNVIHSFNLGLNHSHRKGIQYNKIIYKCIDKKGEVYNSIRLAAIKNSISYWGLRKDIKNGSNKYFISII